MLNSQVRQLYRDVLGREADHGGLLHYARQLKKVGRGKVVDSMMASGEAKAHGASSRERFFENM